ncbi:Dna2/Cas4 domain-containing protein [archaeon]|jgi:CRISPR-associated protein Cas4|nr:Dna2/Cas4 domain-containing protein [archaeon]
MISVTMLCSYLYCPKKFYDQYVLRIKEPPNAPMVKGFIKHVVFDFANKREKEIILGFLSSTSLEDLEISYKGLYNKILLKEISNKKTDLGKLELGEKEVYKELWPFFLFEAKDKAKEIFDFAKKNNVYGESLWFKLPKPISELRIQSSELQLKGVIDKVEKIGNTFIPIEIKTGRAPDSGIWKGHKIQLAAYILLLSEHYGVEVKEGYVDYKEAGKRKLVMNPFVRDEVLEIRDKVLAVLDLKEAPACGCGRCVTS